MALVKTLVPIPLVEGISTETHPSLQEASKLEKAENLVFDGDGTLVPRPGFARVSVDSRNVGIQNPDHIIADGERALLIAGGLDPVSGADIWGNGQYVYEAPRGSYDTAAAWTGWQRKQTTASALLDEYEVVSFSGKDILNVDSAVSNRLVCVVTEYSNWSTDAYITAANRDGTDRTRPTDSIGLEVRILDQDTGITIAQGTLAAPTTSGAYAPRVIVDQKKFYIFVGDNGVLKYLVFDTTLGTMPWGSGMLEPDLTSQLVTVAGPTTPGAALFDVHRDAEGTFHIAAITPARATIGLFYYATPAALSTAATASITITPGIVDLLSVSIGRTDGPSIGIAYHNSTEVRAAYYNPTTLATILAPTSINSGTFLEIGSIAMDKTAGVNASVGNGLAAVFFTSSEGPLAPGAPNKGFQVNVRTISNTGTVTSLGAIEGMALASSFSGSRRLGLAGLQTESGASFIALEAPYGTNEKTFNNANEFDPKAIICQVSYAPTLTSPTAMSVQIIPIGTVREGAIRRFPQFNDNALSNFNRRTCRLPGFSSTIIGTDPYTKADLRSLSEQAVFDTPFYVAIPGNPYFGEQQSDVVLVKVSTSSASLGRMVRFGESWMMSGGGTPSSADTVSESGFFFKPFLSSSGGNSYTDPSGPPAGTYSSIAVLVWSDERGNIYRSKPSPAVSVVSAGSSTNNYLVVSIRSLSKRFRRAVSSATDNINAGRLQIYQTDTNGTVYYLAQEFPLEGKKLGVKLSSTDGYTVRSIPPWHAGTPGATKGAILYTTGGVLENGPPPNAIDIEVFNGRAFALSSQNVLRYSKLISPGIGVEWPEEFALQLSHRGGKAYAIRALNDRLIIFKQNQISSLSGTGPEDTGGGNQFFEPEIVQEGVGAISARGVVAYPDGLMFESGSGVYTLPPNLALNPIGSGIRAITASTKVPGSFTGGIHLSERQEVWFNSLLAGKVIKYNYRKGRWTTADYAVPHVGEFASRVVMASPLFIGSGFCNATTATGIWRERYSSGGDILYIDQSADGATLSVATTAIKSGWIQKDTTLGWQKIYALLFRISKEVGQAWNGEVFTVNFSFKGGALTGGGPAGVVFNILTAVTRDVWKINVPQQKAEAVQVELIIARNTGAHGARQTGYFSIVSMLAEVGVRPGLGPKMGIVGEAGRIRQS